jgi:hypothetical protein
MSSACSPKARCVAHHGTDSLPCSPPRPSSSRRRSCLSSRPRSPSTLCRPSLGARRRSKRCRAGWWLVAATLDTYCMRCVPLTGFQMYFWKPPRDKRAWTYVGLVGLSRPQWKLLTSVQISRAAIEIGLDRTPTDDKMGASELQQRERRNQIRTWMLSFMMDRAMASATGRGEFISAPPCTPPC